MGTADTVTLADVVTARERTSGRLRRTPTVAVDVPTPDGPVPVALKLENLQFTGSFKPRGALNALLQSKAPAVVAFSGGNHGLAVAWAAARLGVKATIVVPASAAQTKVAAMQREGADVIQHGDVPAEALAVAARLVAERGWPLIHPYDQAPTVAGQGTLGLELLEDSPGVSHWLLAVGGGGFPAGVAVALDGAAQVVAVESQGCPTLAQAQRAGHPVPTPAEGIARTSLGAPSIGDLPWSLLRELVGPAVLVDDDEIRAAQLWLWHELRTVAEPGGATALAALLSGRWSPPAGARVGVVVCGGNADALP